LASLALVLLLTKVFGLLKIGQINSALNKKLLHGNTL
jgi:hypothetical protein